MFFCPVQIESRWPQVATEPWNVTSVTKELGFMFYFVLITFKIESHMWLVVAVSVPPRSLP